jgi:hypothetical protein
MLEFLANWGVELVFGLLATAISGGVIWYIKKLKAQIKLGEEYSRNQEKEEIVGSIEDKTKPIYNELENLRSYVRDNEVRSNRMWDLVIDSYKFRLIELCKIHIADGFMTQAEYDQLVEFFKVYTGLGGNGQAKQYYEKAIMLPIED